MFFKDVEMTECIFCTIIRGEIPAQKVYEDDHTIAFLDIHPASKGHTLIVPKKHYPLLGDMPETEFLWFMESFRKIVRGFSQYTDAFNVLQNNGSDAGQLVPHVHFHIIPRRPGDGIKVGEWKTSYDPDLEKVQLTLQSLLKE